MHLSRYWIMSVCPRTRLSIRTADAPGFALPSVVFFMVLVAVLTMAMTRLSLLQRSEGDLALLQERARLMAFSAAEYMRYKASVGLSPCSLVPPVPEGWRLGVEACTPTGAGEMTLTLRVESAGGDPASADYVSYRLKTAVPTVR